MSFIPIPDTVSSTIVLLVMEGVAWKATTTS